MSNWADRQFRTFRQVYSWWRDQLTVMGKVIFLVMVCSLPTLADSGAVLALVFIASSMILFGASAASYLYRPRLGIRVACPENWMQREYRSVQLRITNNARRALIDVYFDLVPQQGIWEIEPAQLHADVIQPGETITVPARVRALRRGLFQLPDLRATTLFPLQLVRRSETHELSTEALILPFYCELDSLQFAQSTASFSRGSNLALQTVGLTGEYVGSREYQPGVPVRKWDYASWARTAQPVVREFSEPRHPSAAVILDTFFADATPELNSVNRELEAILSLAASVTGELIAERNRIDLLTVGELLLSGQDRFSGEDHLAILEQLALAQKDDATGIPELIERIERVSLTWDLVVVISHRWNTEQEHLFDVATRSCVSGVRVLVGHTVPTSGLGNRGPIHTLTCSQIEAGMVDL